MTVSVLIPARNGIIGRTEAVLSTLLQPINRPVRRPILPEPEYPNRTGFIYLITNTVNGKRYVGQTRRSVTTRWREHAFYPTNQTSLLKRAVTKYGASNFRVVVLAEVECGFDLEPLNKAEAQFITTLNTLAPHGYNLDRGGKNKNTHPLTRLKLSLANRGRKASPETRAKMSASGKGKKKLPMSAEQKVILSQRNKGKRLPPEQVERLAFINRGNQYAKGFKHTPETRAKMSAAQRGNKHSLGRTLSPEHAEALHASRRGQGHSEKTKLILSRVNKGRVHSAQSRLNMSQAHQGRKLSAETKAKISASLISNQRARRHTPQ